MKRPAPPAPRAGFTLVEALVALLIMAILAAMAFRGVDAIARARDGSQAATNRTLKLATGISQFEYDVSQVVNTGALAQPVAFDGGTLRLTRKAAGGVELVVWTVQNRQLQRWASPPVTQFGQLDDQWMRSQQLGGLTGLVPVLDDVDDFQVYLCNPNSATGAANAGCSWNNAQTTRTTAPDGVRLTLKLPQGDFMREVLLPHWISYGSTGTGSGSGSGGGGGGGSGTGS
jgi:general secretion pathway protein J